MSEVMACKSCGKLISLGRKVQVTETFSEHLGDRAEQFTTFAAVYCSMKCVSDEVAILTEEPGR